MIMLMAVVALLLLGSLIFSHRYAWWRRPIDAQHPRILMYHMISEHQTDAKFNKLRVTPQQFARQVAEIKRQGYQCFALSELVRQWQAGTLPPNALAITFDDGYQDNLTNALPILQQHNVPATVYVVVDRHDNDWSTYKKSHHNSGELMREPKLSDDELRQLVDSGLIEIGNHTMTHANLPQLSTEQRRWQIQTAKQILSQQTNQAIDGFAYPFGIYTDTDVELVRSLGHTHAVTTIEGIDTDTTPDWWQLKRIKISGKDNMLAFRLRLRTGHRGA